MERSLNDRDEDEDAFHNELEKHSATIWAPPVSHSSQQLRRLWCEVIFPRKPIGSRSRHEADQGTRAFMRDSLLFVRIKNDIEVKRVVHLKLLRYRRNVLSISGINDTRLNLEDFIHR
jgi:hypothetical protein